MLNLTQAIDIAKAFKNEDELYRQAMKELPQKPEYGKYFTK